MNYQFIEGDSKKLRVGFHGTGGNLYSLLNDLGDIDPYSDLLLMEGSVGTGKDRRFFEPLNEGRLNRRDLEIHVENFLSFLETFPKDKYELVSFMGYSNGANFILALIEKNPDIASQYILMHPSHLGWHFEELLMEKKFFISQGANDYLSVAGKTLLLTKELKSQKATVHYELLDSGHEITNKEVITIKKWIEEGI